MAADMRRTWEPLVVRLPETGDMAPQPTLNASGASEGNWSQVEEEELVWQDSMAAVALLSLYALVFVLGLVGNVLVVLALGRCSPAAAAALPVRNNLLVNLCVADLLVTLLCVPVSAISLVWRAWLLGEAVCKAAAYLQSVPVAASTLSLMMLSLDRYAAVKHPSRIFWRQRQLAASKVIIAAVWVAAAMVSTPILLVRRVVVSIVPGTSPPASLPLCVESWSSRELQLSYSATYLLVVYVVPCLTVAVCHASVGYKLCSANLVAAQERTRMMQQQQVLLRRPKQVIIVAQDQATSEAARPRKIIPYAQDEQDSDDDQDAFLQMQIQADLDTLRRTAAAKATRATHKSRTQGLLGPRRPRPRPPFLRATRREKSIVRAHRKLRRRQQAQMQAQLQEMHQQPSLLKTYSNQSFRSRRRLANLLVVLVVVFVACWSPFVAVSLWEDLVPDSPTASAILPFALFLGHAHSAINPFVYWLLNRSFLLQLQRLLLCRLLLRCCCLCSLLRCRCRMPKMPAAPWTKVPNVWRRNSSTNEAALGPFHPKYLSPHNPHLRNKHQPDKCTSHFLH